MRLLIGPIVIVIACKQLLEFLFFPMLSKSRAEEQVRLLDPEGYGQTPEY